MATVAKPSEKAAALDSGVACLFKDFLGAGLYQ